MNNHMNKYKQITGQKREIVEIPIENILPNQQNEQIFSFAEHYEELTESVKIHGILSPLTVTECVPGSYVLISGHRRLEAAKLAGLTTVPCEIFPPMSPEMELFLLFAYNVGRGLKLAFKVKFFLAAKQIIDQKRKSLIPEHLQSQDLEKSGSVFTEHADAESDSFGQIVAEMFGLSEQDIQGLRYVEVMTKITGIRHKEQLVLTRVFDTNYSAKLFEKAAKIPGIKQKALSDLGSNWQLLRDQVLSGAVDIQEADKQVQRLGKQLESMMADAGKSKRQAEAVTLQPEELPARAPKPIREKKPLPDIRYARVDTVPSWNVRSFLNVPADDDFLPIHCSNPNTNGPGVRVYDVGGKIYAVVDSAQNECRVIRLDELQLLAPF